MEKNKSSKKMNLYIIVLALAFVITAISTSFAYFYYMARSNNRIDPESARLGLTVDVKRLTSNVTEELIPLEDDDLNLGVTGTNGTSCVDAEGNGVCQIYEISVTNTGNVQASMNGTLTLTPSDGSSKFTNLKWAEILTPTSASLIGNIHSMADTSFKNDYAIAAGSTAKFYVIIWIDETGYSQNEEDKGGFNGTVEFNAVSGTTITSIFGA